MNQVALCTWHGLLAVAITDVRGETRICVLQGDQIVKVEELEPLTYAGPLAVPASTQPAPLTPPPAWAHPEPARPEPAPTFHRNKRHR